MTFTLLKKVLGENSKIVDGKCKALVQFVKLGWANIVTSEYILENDSTQGRYQKSRSDVQATYFMPYKYFVQKRQLKEGYFGVSLANQEGTRVLQNTSSLSLSSVFVNQIQSNIKYEVQIINPASSFDGYPFGISVLIIVFFSFFFINISWNVFFIIFDLTLFFIKQGL